MQVVKKAIQSEEVHHSLMQEIEYRKLNHKWNKMQKCLKQWQGAWRNRSLIDSPENNNIPYKLSSHTFNNSCRCILKIRNKRTICNTSEQFTKYFETSNRGENLYQSLCSVAEQANFLYDFTSEEKILLNRMVVGNSSFYLKKGASAQVVAEMNYNVMPAKIRKLLPPPLDCEIYTPLCAKKGKILIYYENPEKSNIMFVLEFKNSEILEAEDQRLMFEYKMMSESKLERKWKLQDIRIIYKKPIVDKRTAIEIFCYSGKSVLLNFEKEEERDLFCTKLMKFRDKYLKEFKFECIPEGAKAFEKSKITEDWCNWKISTFDYLMTLNNFSGRSYNNVSQYPVFPWIISDYLSEETKILDKSFYRDLTKNLGMMGEPSRSEEYKAKFFQEDLAGHGRFHFGTHYSNPGIVFGFMMRIFPFFEAYVKFFNGLDDPNRMFHSIIESWKSVLSDRSDLRELIPEFYSLPDMFLNRERLILGKRDHLEEDVNNIVLPKWAKDSPFIFVSKLREALESDITSLSIVQWFDLIFGFQQRGKEAEKAFNIYSPLSYDPGKLIMDETGERKEAFRVQAYHWGQTPLQLTMIKHMERVQKLPDKVHSLWDNNSNPRLYIQSTKPDQLRKLEKVIKIQINEGTNMNTLFSFITYDGKFLEKSIKYLEDQKEGNVGFAPCTQNRSDKEYQNNYILNGWVQIDSQITSQFPVVIIKKHNPEHIAQGGYLNGLIQLTNIARPEKINILWAHSTTVTCLEVDQEECFGISGSKLGDCVIYKIGDEMSWTPKHFLCDHGDAITFIHISNEMQLFITSGRDGVANLYNRSHHPEILRTFRPPLPIRLDCVKFPN